MSMPDASRSVCFYFVAHCVPFQLLGTARVVQMLDSLVFSSRGKVPTLECLVARSFMDRAIGNPRKGLELTRIVEKYDCRTFSGLVFGNCPSVSRFIMENLHVERHFRASNLHINSHIVLYFCPTTTLILFSEKRVLFKNHLRGDIPVEKIVELLPTIFKKPLKALSIVINNDTPNLEWLTEMFIETKDELGCTLTGMVQMSQGDNTHVYLFSQPRARQE